MHTVLGNLRCVRIGGIQARDNAVLSMHGSQNGVQSLSVRFKRNAQQLSMLHSGFAHTVRRSERLASAAKMMDGNQTGPAGYSTGSRTGSPRRGAARWDPDAGTDGISDPSLLSALRGHGSDPSFSTGPSRSSNSALAAPAIAPPRHVCQQALDALVRLREGPSCGSSPLPFNIAVKHTALPPYLEALAVCLERYGDTAWPAPILARLTNEITLFAKSNGAMPGQTEEFMSSKLVRRVLRSSVMAFLPQLHAVPPALLAGVCASLARANIQFAPLFTAVAGHIVSCDAAASVARLGYDFMSLRSDDMPPATAAGPRPGPGPGDSTASEATNGRAPSAGTSLFALCPEMATLFPTDTLHAFARVCDPHGARQTAAWHSMMSQARYLHDRLPSTLTHRVGGLSEGQIVQNVFQSPLSSTPAHTLVALLWVFTRPGSLSSSPSPDDSTQRLGMGTGAGGKDAQAARSVVVHTLLMHLLPRLRALADNAAKEDSVAQGETPGQAASASSVELQQSQFQTPTTQPSVQDEEYDYGWYRKGGGASISPRAQPGERPALPQTGASPGTPQALSFSRLPQLLDCLSTLDASTLTTSPAAQEAVLLTCRLLAHVAHTATLLGMEEGEEGGPGGAVMSSVGRVPVRAGGDYSSGSESEGDSMGEQRRAVAAPHMDARHLVSCVRSLTALHPTICAWGEGEGASDSGSPPSSGQPVQEAWEQASRELLERAHRLMTGQARAAVSQTLHSGTGSAGSGGRGSPLLHKVASAFKPYELTALLTSCAALIHGLRVEPAAAAAGRAMGGRESRMTRYLLRAVSVEIDQSRSTDASRRAGGVATPHSSGDHTAPPSRPSATVQEACRLTLQLAQAPVLAHAVEEGGAQVGDVAVQAELLCAYAMAGVPFTPLLASLAKAIGEGLEETGGAQGTKAAALQAAGPETVVGLACGLAASLAPSLPSTLVGAGSDSRGPYVPPGGYKGHRAPQERRVGLVPRDTCSYPLTSPSLDSTPHHSSVSSTSVRGAIALLGSRMAALLEAVGAGGPAQATTPSAADPALTVALLWSCAAADLYPGPFLAELVGHTALLLNSCTPAQLLRLGHALAVLAARPRPSGYTDAGRVASTAASARPWTEHAILCLQAVSVHLRTRAGEVQGMTVQGIGAADIIASCTALSLGPSSIIDVGSTRSHSPAASVPSSVVVGGDSSLPALQHAVQAYVEEYCSGQGSNARAVLSYRPNLYAAGGSGGLVQSLLIPVAVPALRLAACLSPSSPQASLSMGAGGRESTLSLPVLDSMHHRLAADLLHACGWRVVAVSPVALRGAIGVKGRARLIKAAVEQGLGPR